MLRGFDSRTLEVKFGSLEVELGSKSVVRTHFSRFLASGSKFCTLRFGFGLPRVKSKHRGSQFFDLYLPRGKFGASESHYGASGYRFLVCEIRFSALVVKF